MAEVDARTDYCCSVNIEILNQILQDVSTNKLTLMKELHEILNFVNIGNKKIESKYAFMTLSLAFNDHAMRVRQAIDAVRDVYDIVLQVCLH